LSREVPRIRLPLPDVLGQGRDRPLAPAVGNDPLADVFADGPVEIDQRRVDGGEGLRSGSVDEAQHPIEVGWRRRLGQALLFALLWRLAHAVSLERLTERAQDATPQAEDRKILAFPLAA